MPTKFDKMYISSLIEDTKVTRHAMLIENYQHGEDVYNLWKFPNGQLRIITSCDGVHGKVIGNGMSQDQVIDEYLKFKPSLDALQQMYTEECNEKNSSY